MPQDEEDDSSWRSLQRKKLLESEESYASTSASLTLGHLSPAQGSHSSRQVPPPLKLHSTPHSPKISGSNRKENHESAAAVFFDDADDIPPGIDPDKCYSWLLPSPPLAKRQASSESILSTSSSQFSLPVPPPPDGGWGWFVVLGAFTVSLICDGLAYCFGVLYSELLVDFGESRSKTSMVGSIFFGVAMILGPLASALTTRFGCRKMTIFGGLLSSFGFLLSYFATSIDMLCFTFSIVVGAGFSFCYITSVVIVAFYFDKRRALATGLAVCGTGVGTFTFAPLMNFLISEYGGWREVFLIMSAISLNLVVCGMLFRPLQFTEAERCRLLLEEFNKISPGREELETAGGGRYANDSLSSESDVSVAADGCWGARGRSDSSSEEDDEDDKNVRSLSMLSLPTFVRSTCLAQSSPSPVLIEALRGSKNPHLTMHRYMKNALLQLEHDRLHVRQSQQHLTQRASASSPVDSAPHTASQISPVSDHAATYSRLSPQVSPTVLRRDLHIAGSRDLTTTFVQPYSKPVYITEHEAPHTAHEAPHTAHVAPHTAHVSLPSRNNIRKMEPSLMEKGIEKTLDAEARKPSKTKHLPQHFEFASAGNPLLDRPVDGGRRLSGFYVGRHNALSIHLPLYRTDIFYRRAQLMNNAFPKQACTLGTSCPELTDPTSQLSPSPSRIWAPVDSFLKDACDVFKGMVEFRLFFNPFFLLFVVSNFIYYFWSDVPYMYAADHAIEMGHDSTDASFLLSIIGIFNMIGQVVFGYIGDLDVNLLNVYAVVSALAGVFVGVVPYIPSYIGMCVSYALFGFCTSVSFPLTTVLLVDHLGVSRLTNAYGLLMLMQGIANLFGPPFAGWVSDMMHSYDAAFVMSGFFYFVSGVVLFLAYLAPCRRYEAARSRCTSLDLSVDGPVKDRSADGLHTPGEEGSPV